MALAQLTVEQVSRAGFVPKYFYVTYSAASGEQTLIPAKANTGYIVTSINFMPSSGHMMTLRDGAPAGTELCRINLTSSVMKFIQGIGGRFPALFYVSPGNPFILDLGGGSVTGYTSCVAYEVPTTV